MLADRKRFDTLLRRVDPRIRLAHPGDGPAIQAMLAGLATLEWPDLPTDVAVNVTRWLNTAPGTAIVVAVDGAAPKSGSAGSQPGTKVIGALVIHQIPDVLGGSSQILLDDFFVDPAFRKKGLGEKLIDGVYAIAAAVGAERVWGVLDVDNTRAVRKLEKHGLTLEFDRIWAKRM